MKSYPQARQKLALALSIAAHGESVLLQRRGVDFELRLQPAPKDLDQKLSFEIYDPNPEPAQVQWSANNDGVYFKTPKTLRKPR